MSEIKTVIKDATRRVLAVDYRGRKQSHIFSQRAHSVLLVALKNGESYVLDLTGAQFGWQESIMETRRYFALRASYIEGQASLGTAFAKLKPSVEEDMDTCAIVKNNQSPCHAFLYAVQEWERENGSFRALCWLASDEFEVKKRSLMEVFDTTMIKFLVAWPRANDKLLTEHKNEDGNKIEDTKQ